MANNTHTPETEAEHILATEPTEYTIYTHNGLTMHLCDCSWDTCTFDSCNITGEPSKCEVVGCTGKVMYHKSEGPCGVDRCYTCDYTHNC